ncbi:MAG: hypothetical protein EHM61_17165 [Acidobacteria bacterium]|nr:MAG: hypothetical protein EHM61_17165 [Acidobacteriota bacterium]
MALIERQEGRLFPLSRPIQQLSFCTPVGHLSSAPPVPRPQTPGRGGTLPPRLLPQAPLEDTGQWHFFSRRRSRKGETGTPS